MVAAIPAIGEWMGSVGRKVRGAGDDSETEPDAESVTPDEPDSSLFQCPDCETVYLGTEKDSCAACDTAVERLAVTATEAR